MKGNHPSPTRMREELIERRIWKHKGNKLKGGIVEDLKKSHVGGYQIIMPQPGCSCYCPGSQLVNMPENPYLNTLLNPKLQSKELKYILSSSSFYLLSIVTNCRSLRWVVTEILWVLVKDYTASGAILFILVSWLQLKCTWLVPCRGGDSKAMYL